ncbi:helix-turn-helix domain-containing protein [Tunicatimonas pelagia]|uniref:helix-turn-helix domain-containing protein n=1 Tax=Tunicatimonas pelagia TaxID=931531 RepID=UPI002665D6ED|nr:helix-turn-helix transcriptional regulator [Tunicatimonas pelagia]WKN45303.1 helix-turn-helix transcriptional regulator [Tunicatimonas pelagia]WKN45312.1 helix-turn-helix transcriptional regulator [Tunicatimonas pelagia]
MNTFGKKIAALRKDRKMSQGDLAKLLHTSVSVIGRYERDEMKPSIEAAQKIAGFLDTTVGYLLGETEDAELFKNPSMLQRLQELNNLPEKDKDYILYALDGLLQNVKAKQAFA